MVVAGLRVGVKQSRGTQVDIRAIVMLARAIKTSPISQIGGRDWFVDCHLCQLLAEGGCFTSGGAGFEHVCQLGHGIAAALVLASMQGVRQQAPVNPPERAHSNEICMPRQPSGNVNKWHLRIS